jgi:DNA-binding CsgD family transcriptional regulator
MNQPVSPFNYPDPLQKRMDEKIAEIRAVEKSFAGAIIIIDIKRYTVVYMSQWGRDHLGITLEELHEMGPDYFTRYFNAEDSQDYVPKVIGMLERNNDDEFISHFQQVRRSSHDDWAWYLVGAKVFLRDDAGEPLLTLTIALPVDAQHHIAAKAQRLLEENNFLRNNYHVFDQLTKREREILRMMALGLSSEDMASQLHISETTASTHRRNIKKKLSIESHYDIIRFAQAFDLI